MPGLLKKMNAAKPVYDFTYNLFMVICKLLLIADILITSWVVLARYITVIPAPTWGEEMILTLMSYMAVLSAALAIKRNAHIRMTAFDRFLPRKAVIILDILSDLAVLILALIMLVTGWNYASGIGAKGTYISMTWLSRFWLYFPIPLAGIAMVFFEVERLFIDVERLSGKEETV
ncbi:MAG: TRAP transporter small permease [Lachnospiraceae bacterium]|nr:TRAP transporter small permease [Lachnospiraceae bacterium]